MFFAWIYEDIHDLDPQIAMHHLNIKPNGRVYPEDERHTSFWIQPDQDVPRRWLLRVQPDQDVPRR